MNAIIDQSARLNKPIVIYLLLLTYTVSFILSITSSGSYRSVSDSTTLHTLIHLPRIPPASLSNRSGSASLRATQLRFSSSKMWFSHTDKKSFTCVMSSTESVSSFTFLVHRSLKTSMFSRATLEL
ncbi:hypothetical protein BpHYR1_008487 [Brachionus plicatilis]|uniref:Uncharacterized protein n=1 Tax=Brachionus plicatilis TaxID=10195 RepID=A0A3M7RFF9_BRAPC|nr:hypothetical protein BpHYR1_008487 [Brachionus plicatilis]